MTSCENQQLKSAVVCIDTWLAWLEMCWLHRMVAVFSGCLCSSLPCVYVWHAYVILLHVKPTILDKFRPSSPPSPPPLPNQGKENGSFWLSRGFIFDFGRGGRWGEGLSLLFLLSKITILDEIDGKFSPFALPKSRLGKWHILASARLHPWFWRNRGLLFILLCLRVCRYIYEKGKNSLLTPRGLSAIKEEAI